MSFIENGKGLTAGDSLSSFCLNPREKMLNIIALFKQQSHRMVIIKINVGHVVKIFIAKFFKESRFTNLTNPVYDNWFFRELFFHSTSFARRFRFMLHPYPKNGNNMSLL